MARAHRLLPVFFLALLAAAGASGQAPAVDTPEGNQAVVRRYFQILGGGALTDLDQVIGADFVDRTPGTPGDVHGPEAIRASQRRARELFENVRYTVDDLFADGDRVAGPATPCGRPARGRAAAASRSRSPAPPSSASPVARPARP